ncbi:hypothetical protein [Streptomyces sp. NPDC007984]|uniref:hypothetical protein n=1 Tax=Streptomyces sp. NPDC007984 TaxID=3364801 RepID=UPI0036E1A327
MRIATQVRDTVGEGVGTVMTAKSKPLEVQWVARRVVVARTGSASYPPVVVPY